MFLKTIFTITLLFVSCTNEEKKDNTGLVLALVQTDNLNKANANLASERNSQFILNGSWNSFTGNGTTSNTITTITAKSGSDGIILDDSSGFGGYSSCSIIKEFSNSSGFYITQNPQNNGGCFAGDTNKGRFYKVIYFAEGNRYWTCTLLTAQTTQAAAVALADTSNRTSPGTSGCGTNAWSRLERR